MCELQRNLGENPFIENGVLYFNGRRYTLVEFPGLPNELKKAGGLGGMKRDEGILNFRGIPEEFLPYALVHESFCGFIDGSGKCIDAVKKELDLVPGNIKEGYIQWRIQFFEGMCNYAKNNIKNGAYYQKLLQEMEGSLNYLKGLLIGLSIQGKLQEIMD
ncbi:MAG: hypothetical protein PHH06_05430 [Candidatus Gracilibacteria bacterium]|nr:hypothetical protein [Candidatus Gracilibacteria bacterium]